MNWFRTLALGLAAFVLLSSTGCSLWHNLKPHRMWRLNRVPEGMHKDAYFSVSDPIPDRDPAAPMRKQAAAGQFLRN